MEQSVEDMTSEKNELQKKANSLKIKRDDLHKKSKQMADERDDLNQRIRELRNNINEHKKKRDELNERVKHAKEQRNEINKTHLTIIKKIKSLERERSLKSGVNLNKLKLELKKLENEQMTQIMSPQKEKKLIESIKDIHTQIKSQEEQLNKDPLLKSKIEEEKTFKQKAEKQHDLVEKMAKKAQEEHQQMIELRKTLDNNFKRANEIQENIVMTKIDADTVHKEFIECVNRIHELERTISATSRKKEKKKKIEDISTAQEEANKIFERFKKGEKLSTEDLMILQKAGLL